MEELIRLVSAILSKHEVKYVIIGGIAVLAWGKPRTTFDVDIVLAIFPANLDSVIKDFAAHEFTVPGDAVKRLKRGLAVKFKHGTYSVDLRLGSFSVDKQAIERVRLIDVAGMNIPIASAEDLIVYKLAHFDYRDRSDIETILQRQRKIDCDYIKETASQLALESNKPEMLNNLSEVMTWIHPEK